MPDTYMKADNCAERVRILIREMWKPWLEDLTEKYPHVQFVTYSDNAEMAGKAAQCRAVFGNVNPAVVKAGGVFEHGDALEWVQVDGGGVDSYLMIDELVHSDIVVTCAKIVKGPQIADHAFGLLLYLSRNLGYHTENMRQRRWKRDGGLPATEMRGKRILVVGLGGIGMQVAERAFAFGMRVFATDPKDIPLMRAVEYVGKPDELDSLLPQSDVVVICAPQTRDTEGIFDAGRFSLMKNGSYLINVSRGIIIKLDALIDVLKTGRLAGVGLDVLPDEPLSADSPLWSFPNVIITPHVAWQSDVQAERIKQLFRENVERFLAGLPLRNAIDKTKGY